MSPEGKPSRGKAKHLRKEIGEIRRHEIITPIKPSSDYDSLERIKEKLTSDYPPLDRTKRAELTIQSHWLEFKLKIIGDSERMSRIQKYLDELSKLEPETRKWLSESVSPWLTRLGAIRESVIPATEDELLRRGQSNP